MGHGTETLFQNLSGACLAATIHNNDSRTSAGTLENPVRTGLHGRKIQGFGKPVTRNGPGDLPGRIAVFRTPGTRHHQGRPRRTPLFLEHAHLLENDRPLR